MTHFPPRKKGMLTWFDRKELIVQFQSLPCGSHLVREHFFVQDIFKLRILYTKLKSKQGSENSDRKQKFGCREF